MPVETTTTGRSESPIGAPAMKLCNESEYPDIFLQRLLSWSLVQAKVSRRHVSYARIRVKPNYVNVCLENSNHRQGVGERIDEADRSNLNLADLDHVGRIVDKVAETLVVFRHIINDSDYDLDQFDKEVLRIGQAFQGQKRELTARWYRDCPNEPEITQRKRRMLHVMDELDRNRALIERTEEKIQKLGRKKRFLESSLARRVCCID
jgi:hypothetical protein